MLKNSLQIGELIIRRACLAKPDYATIRRVLKSIEHNFFFLRIGVICKINIFLRVRSLNLFGLTRGLICWLLVFCLCTKVGFAHKPPVAPTNNNPSIKIIENKGQWDKQVLFRATIPGGYLFITANELVYTLVDEKAMHAYTHGESPVDVFKGHVYKTTFVGALSKPSVLKQQASTEYYNFFTGANASHWASGCRAYQTIVLQNLYKGIDMELTANGDQLKLNFIVHPGAEPNAIKLKYTGADKVELRNGALETLTSVALIKEEAPISFQYAGGEKVPVSSSYELNQQELSYRIGNYNKDQPLIIDPDIIFGTFSGSVADNFGFTATFDNAGNAFAGGTVFSAGFPTTTGAFQFSYGGGLTEFGLTGRDVGILKFSPDGKNLLYCTYLGGTRNEQPHSTICNPAGDLYVFGTTSSDNFPTSTNAFDRTYNDNTDMFISRISANGQTLIASTYFGGANADGINGSISYINYNAFSIPLEFNYGDKHRGEILIDSITGSVYVASSTYSTVADGFPIVNGFQTTHGGQQDACIFKMNANLSNVDFSTYLGGSGHDAGFGINFDVFKNVYVCGGSTSPAIGPGSGEFAHHGSVDGFIARISASGSTLMKLLFVGTAVYDQAYFVQTDNVGKVYITGQTNSNGFPVKGTAYRNANAKQFITIFNRNLDSVVKSTTFGSTFGSGPNISPSAFLVDMCNRVYVSGWGGSTNNNHNNSTGNTLNMPITPNAFQSSTDGSDFYLIVLSPDLLELSYGTYIGGLQGSGDHVDGGTSRFDRRSAVYQSVCAGCGGFSDFPTTNGAWSEINKGLRPGSTQGGCNNAIFKMNLNVSEFAPVVKDTILSITATDTLIYPFTVRDPDGDSVIVTFTSPILSRTINPATISINRNVSQVNALLNWKTACNDISTDTFVIAIEAKDNGCPDIRTTLASIKIVVKPPPAAKSPYPECLKPINDSTLDVLWKDQVNSKYLKKFSLFKSTDGSAFGVIDTFKQIKPGFTDKQAKNHLLTNYCYFITASGICADNADTSRTVCSIFKEDTNTTPGFRYSKDSVFEVVAGDTIQFTYVVEDTDDKDSVFVQLSGPLLSHPRLMAVAKTDSLAKSTVTGRFRTLCDDITNSNLILSVYIQDNQCPQPRNARGQVRIKVIMPPTGTPPTLPCLRKLSNNSVQVRWGKSVVNQYFSHYVLLRRNPDGSITKMDTVAHDTAFNTIDNNTPDNLNANYCYAVYPVNICGQAGDTSNWSCTIRKPEDYPVGIDFYTVTVEENSKVGIYWQQTKDATFSQYNLYKRTNDQDSKYTLLQTFAGLNDSLYKDEKVEVQKKSYCYQIKQVNECGLESPVGREACSILLKGKSLPFQHDLTWSFYDYWLAGVKEYEIHKQEPDMSPVLAGYSGNKLAEFSDTKLNIDNGLYYYTVKAIEGVNGNGYLSQSNTIELIQKPLLHVPNAFTPNGDGLNDEFNPKPVFVKDYEIKIYDRWGKLIFTSTKKYDNYKDRHSGNPATSDVFVYLITYTGWDGSSYTVRGNFTTLK